MGLNMHSVCPLFLCSFECSGGELFGKKKTSALLEKAGCDGVSGQAENVTFVEDTIAAS